MNEYCWSLDKNENVWNCDFDSVNDCIADAKRKHGDEIIFVGKKKHYQPTIPAESIIEIISEDVYNDHDDIADEWVCRLHDTTDEQHKSLENDLNASLQNWLKKNKLEPSYFYDVVDVKKINTSKENYTITKNKINHDRQDGDY